MAKKKSEPDLNDDISVDAPPEPKTVKTDEPPYPGYCEYPKWVGGRLVQSAEEEARVKKS